ncbi:hypothetical protein B0E52_05830 [Rhodanobacter sp. C06]|uniref:DUF2306 domain-containing protein n=1 Tax=Rhodanobacter sp. C06 TaxID=1945854 RepID=UPI0009D264E0|nr:DUF2306 domain-containing protein [Rhodanobacter sp. C06]OOG45248.1 hypothetical protein B0E52_05830 [Rhodanobacter sp. C06]
MHERSAKLLRGLAILAFATLSIAVAAYAFAYLYREHSPHNRFAAQFAVSGLDVPAHFFGAGLALLLTPLQLSATVRRLAPRLHRLGGWLAASGILVAALAALSMSRHTQGGAASGVPLAALALVWLFCMGRGIHRIVIGDVAGHRRWMCRTAALTFAAVTLRLILGAGIALHLPPLSVYVFATWACWPLNLAACELLLRQRGARLHPSAIAVAPHS